MPSEAKAIAKEKARIESVYKKREARIDGDLYAPWQPAENFAVSERKRVAAMALKESGGFPKAGDKCLEIGYGRLGWLADLISWGLREADLYGIELDEARAKDARTSLPAANLEVGDASHLQWDSEYFEYAVASTVFSSILNSEMKQRIAGEITRVLKPGGILIWYDLAVNNPRNPDVERITRDELGMLFPGFAMNLKKVTLAPPIARLVAPKSMTFAALLSAIPILRTHLTGVLIKG